ncbi:hypothetical protein AB0L33_16105 [Streptomyces sp. NPDC052299]|uniref:hypothetical protein n=1 Tax=Streptomyces sp. NPDC052299 TaxID=3155054 RepID=UPI00341C9547
MGFHLNCVLALDARVLALYELAIPGGSAYVPRTDSTPASAPPGPRTGSAPAPAPPGPRTGGNSAPALPEGWVLPAPWELAHSVGRLVYDPAGITPADLDGWRAAAGVPSRSDPLDAFDDDDFLLGSFLSLAAPVVVISDSTFGGQLLHEYAAAFREGALVAACGVDHDEGRAFRLADGAFGPADPVSVRPVAESVGHLHDGLRGADLFQGYLPRNANHEGRRHRETAAGPVPYVRADWRDRFPVLRRVPQPGAAGPDAPPIGLPDAH